jgi:ATP-dependent RNA helicase RhlE
MSIPCGAGTPTDGQPESIGLVTISFSDLGLVEPLLRALQAENYQSPTPIQANAIPTLLKGRDLLGVAQTGTGKTAAFALPILQLLSQNRAAAQPRNARALILTPTRELAIQIGESCRSYGRHMGLRQAVVFGGVGHKAQIDALARGVDVLIATPGRLLDLMNQRFVRFDGLSIFVLDEADRMLDMGFIRDVKKVVAALPKKRQTLLFSATMPDEIAELAGSLLADPVRVEVTPVSSTVERIDQRVYFVDAANKRALLTEMLRDSAMTRTLVFTRTKHGANRVAEQLERASVRAEVIHANKSQSARQRALENFRAGRARVLVATDIAARGIDIDGISHVVNFDLPEVPESYVHRIGRTARAGADGTALSLCSAEERHYLKSIEKLTRRTLAVVHDHPFAASGAKPRAGAPGAMRQEGPPRQADGAPTGHRPERSPHAAPGRSRQPRRFGRGGASGGRTAKVGAPASKAARG